MKIVSNINKILVGGLLVLSLGSAAIQPAVASTPSHRVRISAPALGDGQETHGGPR